MNVPVLDKLGRDRVRIGGTAIVTCIAPERRVRVTLAAEQSGASGMLCQTRSSGSLGARLHL